MPTGAKPADMSEQAKKWREGVMGLVKQGIDVEKLGTLYICLRMQRSLAMLANVGNDLRQTSLKTFNDIMNAVAPPISEHEIIQVTVSHDMIGYEGVETLVYRALTKVRHRYSKLGHPALADGGLGHGASRGR